MNGSVGLLMAMIGVILLVNRGGGFTFSARARNPVRALRMTFSSSCRRCCCRVSCCHFAACRAGRKGNGLDQRRPDMQPMLACWVAVVLLALARYRQPLD